jgi:hypothetical protein
VLDHANCAGEHARGARAITGTIVAIATPSHYQDRCWPEATEFTDVRGKK